MYQCFSQEYSRDILILLANPISRVDNYDSTLYLLPDQQSYRVVIILLDRLGVMSLSDRLHLLLKFRISVSFQSHDVPKIFNHK